MATEQSSQNEVLASEQNSGDEMRTSEQVPEDEITAKVEERIDEVIGTEQKTRYEVDIRLDQYPALLNYDATNKTASIEFPDGRRTITHADIIGIRPSKGTSGHDLIYVETSDQPEGNSRGTWVPTVKSSEAVDLPAAFVSAYQTDASKLYSSDDLRYGLAEFEGHPEADIVVSSGSGTGLASTFFSSTLEPLLQMFGYVENTDYFVRHTKSANTIRDLTLNHIAHLAQRGEKQSIFLLTGDGGIFDLINALVPHVAAEEDYEEPTVVLLPLGTGNALAHSVGITRDNTWGLSTLARGTSQQLPMFQVMFSPGARMLVNEGNDLQTIPIADSNDHPVMFGAVVCSWGFHAALVADSDTTEYRKHGIDRFKMAAQENLFPSDGSPPHAYRAKVSLRKKDEEGNMEWMTLEREEHSYVLATFVSNLEKDFVVSPESKSLDGHLRVVHFGHMSGTEVMDIMEKAYQGGKHVEDARVGYEDVDGIKIDFKGTETDGRWRRVCVDGTIVRVEEGGFVQITKLPRGVLNLTVPRQQ